MRGVSPKPVDLTNIVEALNKELIPLIREMRRLLSEGGAMTMLFVPSSYTRTLTAGVRRIWQLGAHLRGIDNELGALHEKIRALREELGLPP
jgi:hypothetical protein